MSPVLDVREVPHAIRHATVFGAVEAVGEGDSLILVAPHDPLPLLGQLEARQPGAFLVTYEERRPQAWRLLAPDPSRPQPLGRCDGDWNPPR